MSSYRHDEARGHDPQLAEWYRNLHDDATRSARTLDTLSQHLDDLTEAIEAGRRYRAATARLARLTEERIPDAIQGTI